MPQRISGPASFAELAKAVLADRRLPSATYRLQMVPHLDFRRARAILSYLDALGVTDLYLSPCLKAPRHSTHGYDICDHRVLNPILGSEADFDALACEVRERQMGLVFDLVPNHMGIADPENAWWTDVLENGPSSPYAQFFDIDWHPLRAEAHAENRVLLPVLAEAYGKALENGDIQLDYERGVFFVTCYDRRMPINPSRYADILSAKIDELTERLGLEHPDALELLSIVTAIGHLPAEADTDPERVAERQREKEIIKRRLDTLTSSSAEVREAILETIANYNGRPGDPASFDELHALLDNQCYRLSFWRVAAEEINYRRFFDVNELAAIRPEREDVFNETHRLILGLIRSGKVTGLRIDHFDGLWNPAGYLRQLQRAIFIEQAEAILAEDRGDDEAYEESDDRWLVDQYDAAIARNPSDPLARGYWIVVEKILNQRESLARDWPTHGTTGYDFANTVNGLFVNAAARKAFTDIYATFTESRPSSYRELILSTKKMIMLVSLSSEINELAYGLRRIAWKHRWYRDLTLNSLTHALREIIAAFQVYRTYLTGDGSPIAPHDLEAIDQAVSEATRRNPRTAPIVFDFIRSVLLQQVPDGTPEDDRLEWLNLSMRIQQTTSPVMAKGVEDTAYYVYNRLASLNDVGGDPEQFGVGVIEFHQQNTDRLMHWPYALLATSTHDSKRSADVRARLDVLSEVPRTWRTLVNRWGRLNRPKKTVVHGQLAPDRNDEYLIYQTLLGAWPLTEENGAVDADFLARIKEYLRKATREANVHGSWLNPNLAYDEAVDQFIERLLGGRKIAGFLADFRRFQRFVAFFGMLNALSMRLLQLTSPGVPDIYQGDELWNLTLVDPDNRGPVDFELRARLLTQLDEQLIQLPSVHSERRAQRTVAGAADSRTSDIPNGRAALVATLLENWPDGRVKLYLIRQALAERREFPDVFAAGAYRGLESLGAKRDHVVAFSRSTDEIEYVVVVPRLMTTLTHEATVLPVGEEIWEDTTVEVPDSSIGDEYVNVLTDQRVQVVERDGRVVLGLSDILASCPVGLLRRRADKSP